MWLLGHVLMERYYTVLDGGAPTPRVGLAPLCVDREGPVEPQLPPCAKFAAYGYCTKYARLAAACPFSCGRCPQVNDPGLEIRAWRTET